MGGQQKVPEDLVEFWVELLGRYPSVVAIIDPMRKQVIQFVFKTWWFLHFISVSLQNPRGTNKIHYTQIITLSNTYYNIMSYFLQFFYINM